MVTTYLTPYPLRNALRGRLRFFKVTTYLTPLSQSDHLLDSDFSKVTTYLTAKSPK